MEVSPHHTGNAMNRFVIRGWVLAALALLPNPLEALVVRLSFEELTQRSQWIVTGTVVRLESSMVMMDGVGECIVTDVTLRVTERLKSQTDTTELVVRILGGTLDSGSRADKWQLCPEAPRYRLHENVLVFLRTHKGALWNTGWQQGKYTIDEKNGMVLGRPLLPVAAPVPLSRFRHQIRLFRQRQPSAPAAATSRTLAPEENSSVNAPPSGTQ